MKGQTTKGSKSMWQTKSRESARDRYFSPSVLICVACVGYASLTGCGSDQPERAATTGNAEASSICLAADPLDPCAPLPHSMKGYELYSWQPTADDWHFTLITGTNRNKSCEEVTRGGDLLAGDQVKTTAVGVDAIKAVLARLPAGEAVFWSGSHFIPGCDLALPGDDIVGAIRAHCASLGLQLGLGS